MTPGAGITARGLSYPDGPRPGRRFRGEPLRSPPGQRVGEGCVVAGGSEARIAVGRDARTCTHESLMPRWRNPQAMDAPDGAMGYVCHRCHAELTPQAARELRIRASAAGPAD